MLGDRLVRLGTRVGTLDSGRKILNLENAYPADAQRAVQICTAKHVAMMQADNVHQVAQQLRANK